MNNSESHDSDQAPGGPGLARYKRGLFFLVMVVLSLLIAYLLAKGVQDKERAGTQGAQPAAVTPSLEVGPPAQRPTVAGAPLSPLSPVPAPPTPTRLSQQAIQLMAENGLQLYQSGDYQAALEAFNTVVAADASNPLAYDVRGSIYSALNDYQSALNDYDQALELNPSFAQAYYNRGRVYSLLKNYDAALADLQKCLELDSANFGYRAQGAMGLIYHQLGEYDKALKAFDASIAYDDQKADAFYWRGEAYSALEDYPAAIEDYRSALELFPDYGVAYQSLGYAYYKTAEYDQAAQALDQALRVSPDSPLAHFYLALLYLATDKLGSAHTEMAQAAKAFPTLSGEEQAFAYQRVVAELQAFAQENPDKAPAVEGLIETIPKPR